MITSTKVVFLDENLSQIFDSLNDSDPIKKGIVKAIQEIKENCQVGENVKKDSPIFYNYKKKYGINNLRVYDLPLAYRLIYTITPNEIEIISVLLDWMNHKDYDKQNKNKR
jgi:hypothetical protein